MLQQNSTNLYTVLSLPYLSQLNITAHHTALRSRSVPMSHHLTPDPSYLRSTPRSTHMNSSIPLSVLKLMEKRSSSQMESRITSGTLQRRRAKTIVFKSTRDIRTTTETTGARATAQPFPAERWSFEARADVRWSRGIVDPRVEPDSSFFFFSFVPFYLQLRCSR